MSKIKQNKEKKRLDILDAAQEVFLSEGYTHASMDKIANQAQVTKQTIYRYYPSKVDLFRETLKQMGKSSEPCFLKYLQESNTEEALYNFAKGFIKAHLSKNHLAIIRLLTSESAKSPEITRVFFEVGPDETESKLSEFFTVRLEIKNVEATVELWTAMLLAYRSKVLVGMKMPTELQIEEYAKSATNFLLNSASLA